VVHAIFSLKKVGRRWSATKNLSHLCSYEIISRPMAPCWVKLTTFICSSELQCHFL